MILIGLTIKKVDNISPAPGSLVRLKQTGLLYEIRYKIRPSKPHIQKLDGENYIFLETGEIRQFEKDAISRADNLSTVAQSLSRLRDIINTNTMEPHKCRWATFTYKCNQTDEKRLYEDFRRFWQRFRYYLQKNQYPNCEYIAAAEPQGRGSWHLHVIFVFQRKAPFIPNDELAGIWGHGFTKIRRLDDTTNAGLYLTAYLGDMTLEESVANEHIIGRNRLKVVDGIDERGQKQRKAIVKGARMTLYPAGFRIYRTSRGIKKPIITECTEAEAQSQIGNAQLVYEKTIQIMDEQGAGINIINYRQYNKANARKAVQPDSN